MLSLLFSCCAKDLIIPIPEEYQLRDESKSLRGSILHPLPARFLSTIGREAFFGFCRDFSQGHYQDADALDMTSQVPNE